MSDFETHPPSLSESGFMRLSEILQYLAISRTTFYRWIAEGRAPKPIRVGPRMSRWNRNTIIDLQKHFEKDTAASIRTNREHEIQLAFKSCDLQSKERGQDRLQKKSAKSGPENKANVARKSIRTIQTRNMRVFSNYKKSRTSSLRPS